MAFTLKQLGYFVAIAEAGSVKAAAEKLFVSESALASALGELEKAGGQPAVRAAEVPRNSAHPSRRGFPAWRP